MPTHRFASVAAGLGLAFLFLHASPAGAVSGGEPPDPGNTRFDAIAAFSQSLWLGLPPGHHNPHNWFCTAVLVAPDTILTAAHCVADLETPGRYAVRFRRKPDGSLGSVAAGVDSFHHARIASWTQSGLDVVIGTLETPVTHIEPIPVVAAGMTRLEAGAPFTHGGWGKEGPGFDEGPRTQLLLCDSELRDVYPSSLSSPFLAPGTGCSVNKYDSGSPLVFVDAETGELRVAATASSVWLSLSPSGEIIGGATGWPLLAADPLLAELEVPFSRADLFIDGVEPPGAAIRPGEQATITVRAANGGAAATTAGVPVTSVLRLSADEVWGNEDDLVLPAAVVASIAGGATADNAVSFTLPDDAPLGAYRAAARINEDGAHAEAIAHNNEAWSDGYALWLTPAKAVYERILPGELTYGEGGARAGSVTVYQRTDGTAAVIGYAADADLGFLDLAVPIGPAGELEVASTDGEVVLAGTAGAPGLTAVLPEAGLVASGASAPDFGASAGPSGLYAGEVSGSGAGPIAIVISADGKLRAFVDAGDVLRAGYETEVELTTADEPISHFVPKGALVARVAYDEGEQEFVVEGTVYQLPDVELTFRLVRERGPDPDPDPNPGSDPDPGSDPGGDPDDDPEPSAGADPAGCGCRAGGDAGSGLVLALAVLALVRVRRFSRPATGRRG